MDIQIISKRGREIDFQELIRSMDLSDSTIKNYNRAIDLYIEWYNIHKLEKEFKDLTMYDYIEYKRWLNTQDYSINTKNSYLTGIMAMYKVLEKHGYTNICSGIRLFEQKAEYSKDGVTIDDWQKILEMIDTKKFTGKKHYLIIYFLYVSGVRQMSLRDLKWGDFGFSSKVNSLVMEVLLKGRGQNRKEKVVINNEGVKILEEYKFRYLTHYANEKGNYEELDKNWYVFGNKTKKLADSSMRKITTEWMKKAGVYIRGEVTPHSFRHGIAEHMIDSGIPLTSVQSLLCHKSINSTKIYSGKREKVKVDKELLGVLNQINIG